MYSAQQHRDFYELSKNLLQSPLPSERDGAEKRASNLRQVINYHEWRYYIQNDPVISDFDYDHLFKQLQAIEDAWPIQNAILRQRSACRAIFPKLSSKWLISPMLLAGEFLQRRRPPGFRRTGQKADRHG